MTLPLAGSQEAQEKFKAEYLSKNDWIQDFLPSNSKFLRPYVQYAASITDAPHEFHFFFGLGLLAASAYQIRFHYFGHTPARPNLWIVALAPSSFFHKSTSLHIAESMLRQTNPEIVLPHQFSMESLCDVLGERPVGVFFWSEFASAMANWGKDYNSDVKGFLAHVYDNPYSFTRKLRKGEAIIKQPYVNVLAASSLSWMKGQIKESDVLGGLLTRILFVPADKKQQMFDGIPSYPDPAFEQVTAQHLRAIMNMKVTVEFDSSARAFVKQRMFEDERDAYLNRDSQEVIDVLFARYGDMAHKVAVLLALDQGRQTVTAGDIEVAYMMLDILKKKNKEIILDMMLDEKAILREKVKKYILIKGECPRPRLLMNLHVSAKQLDEALYDLFERREIKKVVIGSITTYFPSVNSSSSTDKVLDSVAEV